MTVTHARGSQRRYSLEDDEGNQEVFGNHFVFMVKSVAFEVPAHCVHLSNLEELSQYLVMDTACQRTCCSTKWLNLWENRMKPNLRMKPKKTPNSEPFEFGHGDTQYYSNLHAYLPTCFINDPSKACLVGTCVIDSTNDISLLGSNALLCKLQAIIDLAKKEVHLQALGCSVALMTVNGHLSIQMSCFPPDVRKCEIWKILSQKSDEEHADPELVLHEATAVRQSGSKAQDQEPQPDVTALSNANTTTCMASTLASRGAVYGSSSEVGDQKPKLVGSSGPPLALSALAQFSASQAVKRALLRKTRTQQDLHAFQSGQAVAYWRMSGKTRQHKRGAWNSAHFLAWDPDKKSAWLQVGKHSVRIGKTQIRAASGWENWSPTEDDLRVIKDAENNIAQGLWQEELGDQPEQDEEGHIDEEIFSFQPRKLRRTDASGEQAQEELPDLHLPLDEEGPYNLEDVPGPPLKLQRTQEQQQQQQQLSLSLPPQMEEHSLLPMPLEHRQQPPPFTLHLPPQTTQIQQQQQQNQQQNINIQVNVDSPTYQNFGPQTFGPLPPTPHSAQHQHPYQSPATPTAMPIEAAGDLGEEQRPAALTAGQDALPPSTAMVTWHINDKYTFYDNNEVDAQPHRWDGSPEYHGLHLPPDFAYKAYLAGNPDEKEEDRQSVESESDDERGENIMSRQEQKQLDREIPWREVEALPVMMRQKYVESAIKEYNGWMDWKGIRPLDQAEANQVWQDPKMRRRILKSRAAYRDKARGQGPLRAKTRVVLIGCGARSPAVDEGFTNTFAAVRGHHPFSSCSRHEPAVQRRQSRVVSVDLQCCAGLFARSTGCLRKKWSCSCSPREIQYSYRTSLSNRRKSLRVGQRPQGVVQQGERGAVEISVRDALARPLFLYSSC